MDKQCIDIQSRNISGYHNFDERYILSMPQLYKEIKFAKVGI